MEVLIFSLKINNDHLGIDRYRSVQQKNDKILCTEVIYKKCWFINSQIMKVLYMIGSENRLRVRSPETQK